jgi:hypothetical protein
MAYPAEFLILLWQAGMKPAPTYANGNAFNIDGLFTKEDFAKSPECKNAIQLIYRNPDAWTVEKLRKESWRFECMRTLTGKTYVRDAQGNKIAGPYSLFVLDVDSEIDRDIAYRKIQSDLENDWCHSSYVTKTHKAFGFHVFWLEDWTVDDDFTPLDHNDCKLDNALFEIMIGLQYVQVLGQHRNDDNFRYTNIGCVGLNELRLMVRNGLYNTLVNEKFKDLLLNPGEVTKRRILQQKTKDSFHSHSINLKEARTVDFNNLVFSPLANWQINSVVLWANQFYGSNDHYYFFMRSFLGTLVWNWISEASSLKIIDEICDRKGDSGNKSKWYSLIRDAYQDMINGANVEGRPSLIKAIQRNLNYNDVVKAARQVDDLIFILRTDIDHSSKIKIENKENSSASVKKTLLDELQSKIPDKDFVKFAIDITQKNVKQDLSLVKQVTYVGLSTYTDDPINLGVLAPTSEGKTYAVVKSLEIFPKHDVLYVGSMTPKVIIRQSGILVDIDNNPIQHIVDEIKRGIRHCKKSKDIDREEALKTQLHQVYDKARYLIDLSNQIYVFLEPPHPEMWAVLKPILSHDNYEIEHPYVFSVDNQGYSVKKIVTRGWPACIFCSAKNESNWNEWPEIVSRCMITSPNMVKQKYHESNVLVAQKKGLPRLMQQRLIVSDNDIELAKKCILYLKLQIQELAKVKPPVWIPFGWILGEVLAHEKGTDVRATQRMFSLLVIVPLTKIQLRPRLVYGSDTQVIVTLDDLEEVLSITQNQTGMPLFKMKIFKEIFYDKYKLKLATGIKDKSSDGKKEERLIALTSKDICDHYKEQYHKPLSSKILRESYIPEWVANSLVEEESSSIDQRKNIYYPLVDPEITPNDEKGVFGCNFFSIFAIKMPVYCPNVPKNWLKYEIMTISDTPIDPVKIEIYDCNGNKISENDFIN